MSSGDPVFLRREFDPEEWHRIPCKGPELWTIFLDDPRLDVLARSALSPEEEAAERRFASSRHAGRYAAAHGVLRLLLSRWLGLSPRSIRFSLNARGKPFVEGGPRFNLSHAEDMAAVAIVPDCEVGIDVECVKPFRGMGDIAGQYFSSCERAWIAAGQPPEERFFRCWVLREAFVKALGEGLSFPLERFWVRTPPDCTGCAVELRDGGAHDVRLAEWRPAAGFVGALAVRGRTPTVKGA